MSRTLPEPSSDFPGPDPHRSRDRRTAWFAATGVVLLLTGLYVAAVLVAGDRIASGTRVGDVRIGGLAPGVAVARLRAELRPLTTEPVAVSVGGKDTLLDPVEAGLRLDLEATVDRAGAGTTADPRTLWDSLFGGDRVAPVVQVDQGRLIGALRELADRTEVPAVEPAVTFAGARPVAERPRRGTRLDIGQSAVAVVDAWLVDERTVELPLTRTNPKLDADDLRGAVRDARRLVSGPVGLRVPGRDVRLAPARFAPALSVRAVNGRLRPVVDERLLRGRLARIVVSVQRPARDAAVRLVGGRPRVQPARDGLELEPRALANAVLRAASADRVRSARVPGVRTKADFSTRDARRLRIDEVVSEFTTFYPHAAYRNTNIGRAAALINGTVLRPGQTFSLNETVGERTAANGFVEGFIISNGIFAEDFGGGVSQVATTVFNAAFFAGLEDVEHKPHSFYIDRYPVGREATVAWGSVDLRFRNNTPYGVLIHSWIDRSEPGGSGAMRVEMWSTKYWDIRARASQRYDFVQPGRQVVTSRECVPTTGYAGFEIDVFRDFFRPGSRAKVRTETFHTDYIALDTVVCR